MMKLKVILILFSAITLTISAPPAHAGAIVDQQNEQVLAAMLTLNLSPAQKTQLQQVKLTSPEQIESILTPGQHQRWLQVRRAEFGGH